MLEKRERINYLCDFYGEILTPRQQQILDLYYNHDLSLGEISNETGISRQGAHDILKRAEGTLEKLESKLGIFQVFKIQRQELISVLELLQIIEEKQPENSEVKEAMNRIRLLIE